MPIYLDTNDIGTLFSDSNNINTVFVDNQLVFSNHERVVDMGTGVTFNVKDFAPYYADLTTDNFFALNCESYSISETINITSGGGRNISVRFQTYNNYNTTTGLLTMETQCSGYYSGKIGKVRGILVKNTNDLVRLNGNRIFDVKTQFPYEYQYFTSDNFLIKIPTNYYQSIYSTYISQQGSYPLANTFSFRKDYDINSGTLYCYGNNSGYITDYGSWNSYWEPQVYLIRDLRLNAYDGAFYDVHVGGTEQLLPENSSTPSSSPFYGDIKY